VALITPLCVFGFDRSRRRFRLESLHPPASIAEVRRQTGFEFDCAAEVPQTRSPDPAWLALLRDRVAREIADPYPAFATRLFAVA
jgi:glutaconate CoA-transferase subunit B